MRIVCIMIDTLRYDFFKMGGARREYAPDLDDFAREACWFDHHYVSSFPTVPNREDIMTGRYSFPHHGWAPLPEDAVPMAQILSEAGYLTQLICDTPNLVGRGLGYQRGFQGWNWIRGNENDVVMTRFNKPIRSAMPKNKTRIDEIYFGHYLADLQQWINPNIENEQETFIARTAMSVSQWIEDNYRCKDFLLWVDTFEVHEPYIPPKYLQDKYDPDYRGTPMIYPCYGYADAYTPEEIRNMAALYAGEVDLTSKWVCYILRKLADVGIYDDCLICIMSDHGDYVGEHNRMGKLLLTGPKRNVFTPWIQHDEVNRIPLMIKMPKQTKGRRIAQIVQPVDYLPTILDLCGVKSDLTFDGFSLRPVLEGQRVKWPRTQAYSSNSIRARWPNFWTAINTPDWALHLGGEEADGPVLFDRKRDPNNLENVAGEHPAQVQRMGREYIRFLESVNCAPEKIALMEQKLRA